MIKGVVIPFDTNRVRMNTNSLYDYY